jgi:hypothetical protein
VSCGEHKVWRDEHSATHCHLLEAVQESQRAY